jgi:hypothetical protein
MIFLIGLGMIVAGLILCFFGAANVDGGMPGPDFIWATLLFFGIPAFCAGWPVALVGLGLWLAEAHVWRF